MGRNAADRSGTMAPAAKVFLNGGSPLFFGGEGDSVRVLSEGHGKIKRRGEENSSSGRPNLFW